MAMAMAVAVSSRFSVFPFLFFATLFSFLVISSQQPVLDSPEQESVYQVLDAINPTIPWRSLYPDDLCSSPIHGLVCDYFTEPATINGTVSFQAETVHITELSFGNVSEYSANPPCTPNSTLSPLLFTSFNYLRKLFFYKCFTGDRVSVPENVPAGFGSSLEELVFIENPSLVGSLGGIIGNYTNLRRLVLVGNGVYGTIPDKVGGLVGLEEITLSRNKLSGGVSSIFAKLKKLRILDLSQNYFDGNVPEELGNLPLLLKLDLSYNVLSGKIPESFGSLQSLEFLDLSFNRFGNFGVPLFLGRMSSLRSVFLSGNAIGGQIPEIWENLGGILGIGFSGMGLVGAIPPSMGVHLKNLCYLGLDNNSLQGRVPEEFGGLDFLSEINLENNNLSGRVPFSANFSSKAGGKLKLKLKGNPDLCIDEEKLSTGGSSGELKLCSSRAADLPNAVLFNGVSSSPSSRLVLSSSSLLLSFLVILMVLAG